MEGPVNDLLALYYKSDFSGLEYFFPSNISTTTFILIKFFDYQRKYYKTFQPTINTVVI